MAFFQNFLRALLPGRHYADLVAQPPATAFRYFITLSLATGLLHWLLIVQPLQVNVRLLFEQVSKRVPPFEIDRGRAIVLFPQPKIIPLPFDAELVIDTTGRTTLPPPGTPVAFLLSEKHFWVRAGGQVLSVPLPEEKTVVDTSYWNRLADIWSVRVSAFALSWLLIKTFFAKFLQVVLLSGVVMFWDVVWKTNWDFRLILNLCFYGVTPACLLGLLLGMVSDLLPSAYIRMAIYYCFFATFLTLSAATIRGNQSRSSY